MPSAPIFFILNTKPLVAVITVPDFPSKLYEGHAASHTDHDKDPSTMNAHIRHAIGMGQCTHSHDAFIVLTMGELQCGPPPGPLRANRTPFAPPTLDASSFPGERIDSV